jgi:type IV secretory pathway VirB4 component
VAAGRWFTAGSATAAGLFPFVAGSGAPRAGIPVGHHLFWGEAVHVDPFAWLEAGLTTNTGMFHLGQPGTGKSAFAKRQVVGMVAAGVRPVILGDPKGEYTALVERLGGQVIRMVPGRAGLNPLDAPVGGGQEQVRSARLSLVLALCGLVRRERPLNAGEQVVLAAALDELTAGGRAATLPGLLAAIADPAADVRDAAGVRTRDDYDRVTQELRWTLELLLRGPLMGILGGPGEQTLDAEAPAVAVDVSALEEETSLSAAMLCAWAWGRAAVAGAADRRAGSRWFLVVDELWRTLRGAPGLVDHVDAITRLNRSRGIASLMITHSLQDLEALADPADVAKAMGFIDRSGIVVLSGLPRRELDAVGAVVTLTEPEKELVASWSAVQRWRAGQAHPGRGRYLIKAGSRPGLPVVMGLGPGEARLYDTDPGHTRRAADDFGR